MFTEIQYLTPEGLKDIETRLKYLKEVRRVQVAARLRQALDEGGDLNENADYKDAKDEQSYIEGEILRLENIVSQAQVIETPAQTGKVVLGATVTVIEQGSTKCEVYQLVGSVEANPTEGKISIECPVGRALLGAKVGDKVIVNAPEGKLVFIVKSIH
jgi:transcription elongation factor GreA